jgi:hypothetical protein
MKRDMMKTILYIDEYENLRFLLREALSKFNRAKPGLIILEFRQKNVGEESFKKLREQYKFLTIIDSI